MKTYNYTNALVKVCNAPRFTFVYVYNLEGKKVYEAYTQAKGVKAAEEALADAKSMRLI